jgi:hypothetical protein
MLVAGCRHALLIVFDADNTKDWPTLERLRWLEFTLPDDWESTFLRKAGQILQQMAAMVVDGSLKHINTATISAPGRTHFCVLLQEGPQARDIDCTRALVHNAQDGVRTLLIGDSVVSTA